MDRKQKQKQFQVLILLFDFDCICDSNDVEGLLASTGLQSLQGSENAVVGYMNFKRFFFLQALYRVRMGDTL